MRGWHLILCLFSKCACNVPGSRRHFKQRLSYASPQKYSFGKDKFIGPHFPCLLLTPWLCPQAVPLPFQSNSPSLQLLDNSSKILFLDLCSVLMNQVIKVVSPCLATHPLPWHFLGIVFYLLPSTQILPTLQGLPQANLLQGIFPNCCSPEGFSSSSSLTFDITRLALVRHTLALSSDHSRYTGLVF